MRKIVLALASVAALGLAIPTMTAPAEAREVVVIKKKHRHYHHDRGHHYGWYKNKHRHHHHSHHGGATVVISLNPLRGTKKWLRTFPGPLFFQCMSKATPVLRFASPLAPAARLTPRACPL